MKVALVHDWLNSKRGGGENVLLAMAEMYPDAPVYTLLYDQDNYPELKGRVHESFLRRFPKFMKKRPRYLMPLIPQAIESFDLSEFDVVISSSCAYSKNVLTQPGTTHISYCHSPARMYWDYWARYIDEQNVGPVRRGLIRGGATLVRMWDHSGTDRVDVIIANSKTTQARISKYYRREADIIYPPVEVEPETPETKGDYYVTLGVLTPYKRIDLAIEAFNISGKTLKIIGDGPDRKRLEAMAENNIEFIGRADDEVRNQLLRQAKGFIFPNEEDFGIISLEAMALGTPVIAYNKGGATETVIDKQTGILFEKQTVESLNHAVAAAEDTEFKTADMHAQARKFDRKKFEESIKQCVADHGSK